MKRLLLIAGIVVFLLSSCDFLGTDDEYDGFDPTKQKFWAQNMKDKSYYQVEADLLVKGSRCNIWVEAGSGVTKTTAQNIANKYDNNIYQKMIDNFSIKNFNFEGYTFSDIMEFADALTDEDGKLCILLLDIKDNYEKGKNDSYVGGYFWGVNLLQNDPKSSTYKYSNEKDMIYVDTNPGVPDGEESFKTLAHEMQHMMNFATSLVKRIDTDDILMDTWIDEGLSSAAEWAYSGKMSADRISWFNNNGVVDNNGTRRMTGLIDKGNNFFVWGTRDNESPYANLDDYATVNIFFQWLRLQKGSSSIYKDIITSEYCDYQAVTNAAKSISNNYNSWDTLLKTWLAANHINSSSGEYGYKGESAFSGMKAPAAPAVTSLNLLPGEGVYSKANTSPSISGQGANIANAYLTTTTLSNSFSSGSTLLTYNKNQNLEGAAEKGVTTGAAPASISIASGDRSVSAYFTGPYRIDAGDLLGRDAIDTDNLKMNLSKKGDKAGDEAESE